MRTKDEKLLGEVQEYIEDYCDNHGYGPTVLEVAGDLNISSSCAQQYMSLLEKQGRISKGRKGYESLSFAQTERATRSVAILGAVPCGALTEVHEYIEGYIRLPESFLGQGKFYILTANGKSMIDAGIDDGDLVLIKQQETADIDDIVVALVENEVTLKRLAFDDERKSYYLHPENKAFKDIYVDELTVQGVAVKVIKDLI